MRPTLRGEAMPMQRCEMRAAVTTWLRRVRAFRALGLWPCVAHLGSGAIRWLESDLRRKRPAKQQRGEHRPVASGRFFRRRPLGMVTRACTSLLHQPFAPALCTSPLHQPFAPALCTSPLHQPFAPALCTSPLHLQRKLSKLSKLGSPSRWSFQKPEPRQRPRAQHAKETPGNLEGCEADERPCRP
jgi:hypothetical protein